MDPIQENQATKNVRRMIEQWFDPKDFPDVLNDAGNNFSTDVFVYCESTNERTVGWFDFKIMTWCFLCREPIGKKWKWRYFNDKIDKY